MKTMGTFEENRKILIEAYNAESLGRAIHIAHLRRILFEFDFGPGFPANPVDRLEVLAALAGDARDKETLVGIFKTWDGYLKTLESYWQEKSLQNTQIPYLSLIKSVERFGEEYLAGLSAGLAGEAKSYSAHLDYLNQCSDEEAFDVLLQEHYGSSPWNTQSVKTSLLTYFEICGYNAEEELKKLYNRTKDRMIAYPFNYAVAAQGLDQIWKKWQRHVLEENEKQRKEKRPKTIDGINYYI